MSAWRFFHSDDAGTVHVTLSERGHIYLEGFMERSDGLGGARIAPEVARKTAAALLAAARVSEAEQADPPPDPPITARPGDGSVALVWGQVLTADSPEPPVGTRVLDAYRRTVYRALSDWWIQVGVGDWSRAAWSTVAEGAPLTITGVGDGEVAS